MKFPVELSGFPALCANKKIGAKLGPITFKRIVPNQGIARSIVTNKRQIFVWKDALYIGLFGAYRVRRSTDSSHTNRVQLSGSFSFSMRVHLQQLRPWFKSTIFNYIPWVISTHTKIQSSTLKYFSGYNLLGLPSSVPEATFQPSVTTVPSAITVNVSTFQPTSEQRPLSH